MLRPLQADKRPLQADRQSAAARLGPVRLADAVTEAIVEQYTEPGDDARDALLLITTGPALRDAFLGTAAEIEAPLTAVIADRIGDTGQHTAQVLAASVAAAVRVALERWLRPATPLPAGEPAEQFSVGELAERLSVGEPAAPLSASGLVVPSGSLPGLLRASLAPLAPALDAAEHRSGS